MGKDTWPGWLDVSVAGHLGAGEEALDGRRELEEEIGLRVRPERLIPLGERFVELRIPEGLDREFHDVFLLEDSTPPERLRLQREEVESVVEIPLPGAKAMAKGETVRATEYRDGRSTQVRVSLSDFVPTGDGYIRKVVEAVEEVLAGEEPGEVF